MTEFEKHPLFRELVAVSLADQYDYDIIEKFGIENCDNFAKNILKQLDEDSVDIDVIVRNFVFTVIGNKIEQLKGV